MSAKHSTIHRAFKQMLAVRRATSTTVAVAALFIAIPCHADDPKPLAVQLSEANTFPDPLVPVGADPSDPEVGELLAALRQMAAAPSRDDVSAIQSYLDTHPSSPYRSSLLLNLGSHYYRTGWFSKALETWNTASTNPPTARNAVEQEVVDASLGEYMKMNARIGRMDVLEEAFTRLNGRALMGKAENLRTAAAEGLDSMKTRPGVSFRCGPLALSRILTWQKRPAAEWMPAIQASQSTTSGISLPNVLAIANSIGMNYRIAKRSPGAEPILPCVVHWKVGHYASLVAREQNGLLHLSDPTFGNDLWISQAALDGEASGFFLVPDGPLPAGWQPATTEEAAEVYGKGMTNNTSDDECGDDGDGGQGSDDCDDRGMPRWKINPYQVGLSIRDEPVGYSPPVGPAVRLKLCYTDYLPNRFGPSSFGHAWVCNWFSHLTDDTTNPAADVEQLILPQGGVRRFKGYSAATQTWEPEFNSSSILRRVSGSPVEYRVTYQDGSEDVYSHPVGSGVGRKIYLTQRVDPQGNAVTLEYDAYHRLSAVVDAINQRTTFQYSGAPPDLLNPYCLVTSVTDPFGRTATFEYDANGLGITSITDVLNLESTFTYPTVPVGYSGSLAPYTRILSLTTPYGTTTFERSVNGRDRKLVVTDPQNDKVVAEYRDVGPPFGLAPTDTELFQEFTGNTSQNRNTFIWGRKEWHQYPGDYSKATVYHWGHGPNLATLTNQIRWSKKPLEFRVFSNYPNMSFLQVGTSNLPIGTVRLLPSGQQQTTSTERNAHGRVTKSVDPLGRTTEYLYAANGIDLLEVRQKTGDTAHDRLALFTYNDKHQPLTYTDAANQTTTYTYNTRGQILTQTNALGHVTTYHYNAQAYLTSIDGPLPGPQDTVSYTYDTRGNVQTVTDVDGYTLTYAYDALNRLTRTTYPDATYEETTFDRLDRATRRDREGRVTTYTHNALRQIVSETDPANRTLRYEWCRCGSLRKLFDPMGRQTTWVRDVQGRPVEKIYADGSKETYQYDIAGRLVRKTDAKGQFTDTAYHPDNSVASVSYPNADIPTPTCTYSYDANYRRITKTNDGEEDMLYTYHPAGSPGANRLASQDGTLLSCDTITYGYDALGRMINRTLDGDPETWSFDAAGRVLVNANALGTFTHTYHGATKRLASVQYPNGVLSTYSFFDSSGDRRLQQIKHANGPTVLAQYDYTYQPAGNISTWKQKTGADQPSLLHTYSYDLADQLLGDVVTDGPVVVKSYAYSYDSTGNRLDETIDGNATEFHYNEVNELVNLEESTSVVTSYSWDGGNRLRSIAKGGQTCDISCNANHFPKNVRWPADPEKSVRWIYSGTTRIGAANANGTLVERIFGRGELRLPMAAAYIFRDHLRSPRVAVDISGNTIAASNYEPFGRSSGPGSIGGGFTGHASLDYFDLCIAPFRVYHVLFGRWLQRDPLEYIDGVNLFQYVNNNPVAYRDSLGLFLDGDCFSCSFGLVQVTVCSVCSSNRCETQETKSYGYFGMGGCVYQKFISSAGDPNDRHGWGWEGGASGGPGPVIGGVGAAGSNPLFGGKHIIEVYAELGAGVSQPLGPSGGITNTQPFFR